MKNHKIGCVTLFTGYNYGTSLQAFALKKNLELLGYNCDILWRKNVLFKGRNVSMKKLLSIMWKLIIDSSRTRKSLMNYKNSFSKYMSQKSVEKFDDFTHKYIAPKCLSSIQMKKKAKTEYQACICGSDQIWGANDLYVDPIFYLRFVPRDKRVAYAPSFGASEVAKSNRKRVKKYLSDFPCISVREQQGVEIVKALINRKAEVVLDPTLLLDKKQWKRNFSLNRYSKEQYFLLYFLDEPNEELVNWILQEAKQKNFKVYAFPYLYHVYMDKNILFCDDIGPVEFIDIICNTKLLFTDSFHGVAFSINLQKPFWVFPRAYGRAVDQSSRITSILNELGLEKRYVAPEKIQTMDCYSRIDYVKVEETLNSLRKQSIEYLTSSIEGELFL